MKNKYIFLIIALGFGAYFLMRPAQSVTPTDGMAQAVASFDCDSIRNTTLKMICKMKFFILGGSSNTTGGNTGSTGGNNGGNAGGTGGSSGSSAAINSYKNNMTYIIMNPDGSQTTGSMAFPMQPGPTYSSIFCRPANSAGYYKRCMTPSSCSCP